MKQIGRIEPLSDEEISLVSGGYTLPDGTVVVTGSGTGRSRTEDYVAMLEDRPSGQPNPELSPAPGGGGDDWSPESPRTSCEKDNKALELARQIIAEPEINVEYGGMLYRDPFGGGVEGTGVFMGNEDHVSPSVPSSVGVTNVFGNIHEHRTREPTGDAGLDARLRVADMYPSPGDRAALSDLAFAVIAAGGNPFTLSVYIIDAIGEVRRYNWADMRTYYLSENQLLQVSGQAPLPLPPPPLTWRDCSQLGNP